MFKGLKESLPLSLALMHAVRASTLTVYSMLEGRVARAGRSGTAYSLVSPDEMPFLLDLHLFLGKPIKWVTDANKSCKCYP